MILQLNPAIPVIVTSKDNAKGYAIFVIDYSQEHPLYWTVALDNGQIWTVPNPEIRIQDNWTIGRREGLKCVDDDIRKSINENRRDFKDQYDQDMVPPPLKPSAEYTKAIDEALGPRPINVVLLDKCFTCRVSFAESERDKLNQNNCAACVRRYNN